MPTASPQVEVSPAWERRSLERSLGAARDRSSLRAHRLVDAARALTAERGSSGFTVADVAVGAGISLRSFYRHFSGRDDLLLALLEEEAQLGARLLEGTLAEAAERLWDFSLGGLGARRSLR